jgi:hypothetical protein
VKLQQPLGEKAVVDEQARQEAIPKVIPQKRRKPNVSARKGWERGRPEMESGPLIGTEDPPGEVEVIPHTPLKERLLGIEGDEVRLGRQG